MEARCRQLGGQARYAERAGIARFSGVPENLPPGLVPRIRHIEAGKIVLIIPASKAGT
jgi:hypothetical protein